MAEDNKQNNKEKIKKEIELTEGRYARGYNPPPKERGERPNPTPPPPKKER